MLWGIFIFLKINKKVAKKQKMYHQEELIKKIRSCLMLQLEAYHRSDLAEYQNLEEEILELEKLL